MDVQAKPCYKRILLKLSGEALMGEDSFGINRAVLQHMIEELRTALDLGVQVGIVVGGGNIFRGVALGATGMDRATGDYMGMLAAGTGNPFMTTDTTAALRGAEVGADIVLKATKVDGIYTADPKKDPTATMYDEITFDEALRNNLKVMDATAFALCREQGLPIKVFNINKKGALRRVLLGEKEGTLVHS